MAWTRVEDFGDFLGWWPTWRLDLPESVCLDIVIVFAAPTTMDDITKWRCYGCLAYMDPTKWREPEMLRDGEKGMAFDMRFIQKTRNNTGNRDFE